MAWITKRGERRYLIRISTVIAGKRRIISKTIHGTRAEAKKAAAEMETELFPADYDTANLRLRDLADLWLDSISTKVAGRTADFYRSKMSLYVLPFIGSVRISRLNAGDIQQVYNLHKGKLSPTTIRHIHATLRACLRWGLRKGLLRRDPAGNPDLPKARTAERAVLSPEQARRFIAAARLHPHGVLLEFALETGMRPGEYLALRWSDIVNGEAHISRSVQFLRKGGGWEFTSPKTRRSCRRVPLSNNLQERLRAYRIFQQRQRLASPVGYDDHNLVFANAVGRPRSVSNVRRRILLPILAAAGLSEQITLYSLRHSCATLLLISGVNPKVVSDRLGHASVNLTLNTYSHVLPHIQEEATEKLRALIM